MISWYYKLGKKQAGPVSSEELVKMVKAGAIKPDTQVWHAAMTAWRRAGEISEPELFFAEASNDIASEDRDPASAGPWPRFWARLFDIYFLTLVLGGTAGVLAVFYMPSLFFKLFNLPELLLNILFLPLAGIAAAIMMRVTGTTIGKAIVGIKVQAVPGSNTLLFYIKREFKVWIFGLGGGIPLINLITMINQHQSVARTGSARYDQGVAIVTSKNSTLRCTVAALAFIGLFSSSWYLGVLDKSATDDVKISQDWVNPSTGEKTFISKAWAFEELEAEFGKTYYFSSNQLLAEMVFGYEPLDQEDIDPVAYGEALQEGISEDVRVISEWKPVKVAGMKAVRAYAVHKSAKDTNVEITVSIVGKSAWRLLIFTSGRPVEKVIEGKAAAQALFSTIKDINVPTDLPCEGGRCV